MYRTLLGAMVLLLCVGLVFPADAADLKKLKKDIKKAIQGGEPDTAMELISEIAAIGDEKAIAALFKVGKKYAVTEALYKKVIEELAGIQDAAEWVVKKGDKSKGTDLVFIGDICTACADQEIARNFLVQLMEEKSPIVRGVAVTGLEKSAHHDAIEPLIDLLEALSKKKRKNVLYYKVRDALFNLTFQDFDLIQDWRNWWAPNKGSFDPKKLDEAGKTGVKRKKRGDDADFFGVPITSKNVVFVIDTSGSMALVQKDDIPGLGHTDGSDSGKGEGGSQMTPEDLRLAHFWRRMEMAKRELKKCITAVKSDTLFNIVTFNTETKSWKKKAFLATPKNKKNAIKFTDDLRFIERGNTNTQGALDHAFRADKKTNTIFFLSDGLPSMDGMVNDPTGPILDRVFRINRFRKIKINTFGFDSRRQDGQISGHLETANEFLKQLAKATGGTYSDMKVDNSIKPPKP